MGTLLVVLLAFVLWGVASFVANEGIDRHVRGMILSVRRGESFVNDFYQAFMMLFLALALFVVGTAMMAAVLSGGQVTAMAFGVAFLAGAFVSWRHYRSTRQDVVLHLAAGAGLLLSGSLVLAIGL